MSIISKEFEKIKIEFKKYKIIYSLLILCFLAVGFCIFKIYSNINSNSGTILSVINSIYTSLILALISLITALTSSLNNKKILNQNEESRFIQLRFQESKDGIYELRELLQKTCTVFKQLKDFLSNTHGKRHDFISPRAFLIMQFVYILANHDLLNKLPLHIRSRIQFKFKDKVTYNWNEESEAVLHEIDTTHVPYLEQFYFETIYVYEDCIIKFRKTPHYEYTCSVFKVYYSSDISEEEFLSHFIDIFNEISSTKLDDLILKDKEIVLNELHYEDFFEEYMKD